MYPLGYIPHNYHFGWATAALEGLEGDFDAATTALNKAVEREDALNYDEPPTWHYPVRQSLGAVLLQAGEAARADRAMSRKRKRYSVVSTMPGGMLMSL